MVQSDEEWRQREREWGHQEEASEDWRQKKKEEGAREGGRDWRVKKDLNCNLPRQMSIYSRVKA